jgi:hypothetical protein
MMPKDDPPFVHVYSQYREHSPATIRCTKAGLLSLKAAVDHALAHGSGSAEALCTDGEHYEINIQCREVVSALGDPEYAYQLEYRMGQAEARRADELKLKCGDMPKSPAKPLL